MDFLGKFILSAYGIAIAICIVLLVYLIIRRGKIKKSEDFEERNN